MARILQLRQPASSLAVLSEPNYKALNVHLATSEGLRFCMTPREAARIAAQLISTAAEYDREYAVETVTAVVDDLMDDKAGADD